MAQAVIVYDKRANEALEDAIWAKVNANFSELYAGAGGAAITAAT